MWWQCYRIHQRISSRRWPWLPLVPFGRLVRLIWAKRYPRPFELIYIVLLRLFYSILSKLCPLFPRSLLFICTYVSCQVILARFEAIEPTFLFASDEYLYAGKKCSVRSVVEYLADRLPTLKHTIAVPFLDKVTLFAFSIVL